MSTSTAAQPSSPANTAQPSPAATATKPSPAATATKQAFPAGWTKPTENWADEPHTVNVNDDANAADDTNDTFKYFMKSNFQYAVDQNKNYFYEDPSGGWIACKNPGQDVPVKNARQCRSANVPSNGQQATKKPGNAPAPQNAPKAQAPAKTVRTQVTAKTAKVQVPAKAQAPAKTVRTQVPAKTAKKTTSTEPPKEENEKDEEVVESDTEESEEKEDSLKKELAEVSVALCTEEIKNKQLEKELAAAQVELMKLKAIKTSDRLSTVFKYLMDFLAYSFIVWAFNEIYRALLAVIVTSIILIFYYLIKTLIGKYLPIIPKTISAVVTGAIKGLDGDLTTSSPAVSSTGKSAQTP